MAERAVAVCRYHEVALKGRNRPMFVRRLAGTVQRVTADLPVGPVRTAPARLLLPVRDASAWPAIRERLVRVFGIANLGLAYEVPLAVDAPDAIGMIEPVARALETRLAGVRAESFRVHTKRADKQFPLGSPEVNAVLGARIKPLLGARVDLDAAALTIDVDLLRGRAFFSFEKVPGPGGLPVGTSGRVVALLSGGIDSPVAAWRLMRRGCRVDFVHFHSAPFTDRSGETKARELAHLLVRWELDAVLHVVPFGEVQRQIVATATRPLRVVLYRRMMLRIAERIARATGAAALVTGESLGQVASQTLANLAVIDAVAELPVLRPLVGMDKGEIMDQAARLGTFETSVQPDQDCCQLFVPRHPTTRANPAAVAEAEARFDVAGLVALAAGAAERVVLRHPPQRRGVEGAPSAA
ncbi:MAG: tRNA uracil 4-sulfurtransferase ThiI [Candidatus Binatia bacterium]